MIETLLLAVLLADAGVTAIVGAGDAARIYPDVLEQAGALPALVFQRIDDATQYSHDGAELVEVRVQIDSYARTRIDAQTLAKAVRDALHTYAGDPDGIHDFKAGPSHNLFEDDEAIRLYRVSSDYFAYARDAAA